jgi:hypothetical protein
MLALLAFDALVHALTMCRSWDTCSTRVHVSSGKYVRLFLIHVWCLSTCAYCVVHGRTDAHDWSRTCHSFDANNFD